MEDRIKDFAGKFNNEDGKPCPTPKQVNEVIELDLKELPKDTNKDNKDN